MSFLTVRCLKCNRLIEVRRPDGPDSGSDKKISLTITCPHCGSVSTEANLDPTVLYSKSPGKRKQEPVGHFQLLKILGHGSAGEVWLAEDINLGRQVALKLPRNPNQETMSLLHEAKTAASLRHPNIVSIYEVGLDGDQVFIASEYIDGLTLRDFMTAKKPTVERTVDLLLRIARALHYAHQQGIVHRDVKPANILLDKTGQPYVADFGLAKSLHPDATVSDDGQVVGTARYMSPEQAAGNTRETDARSDLYALGVMLFEMLTGEPPFRGNMRALLDQKVKLDPPTPRLLNPSLPRDLETICLKCIERDPAKRYTSTDEFADELARFVAGEPIRARPITRLERAWRWCRRRPVVSGLVASLFLSLTVGLLGVTFFWRQAERNAQAARESLYRSQMNLAAAHLGHGDIAGVREMIVRVAANPETAHLRGFEWDYIDRLIAPMTLVANHGDGVQDVAISRDGDVCASIGTDKRILVWDTKTSELIRTLTVDDKVLFQSIDFSPTTMRLVSGSGDGFVRVWNPLQDGRAMQTMQHGPKVKLVRFSPDGTRILATGDAGAIRVWETDTAKLLAAIPIGKRAPTIDVRFSADSKKIVIASHDGHMRVWDIDKFKDSPTPDLELDSDDDLRTVALADEGQLVVTGNYRGKLRLQNTADGSVNVYQAAWGRIDDMEFIPRTSLLAVVSSDGQLHLLDTILKQEIRAAYTHGLAQGALARSANGKSLVIGSGDGSVILVKLETLSTPAILWHDKPVRDLVFDSTGTHIVSVENTGRLTKWDLIKGTSRTLAEGADGPERFVSLQPGGHLLASTSVEPTVTVWDIDKNALARELPIPPKGARLVKFSALGLYLAVVPRGGKVQIFDTRRWDAPAVDVPVLEKINTLTFSPDDKLLAVALDNKTVAIAEVQTGKIRETIPLKTEPTALHYCEAGRLLAIGTNVGEIHLWDLTAKKARFVIRGHTARINVLTTLPRHNTLVSAGLDRQLKLWDMPTGELISPLVGHPRQVFSIAVSPDGGTIVSGGLAGDIRVWIGQGQ